MVEHSPISPMSREECAWIHGKLSYQQFREPGGYVEVEDDLPFEWDRQHSCCHGSERDEAGCLAGACVAVCSAIILWLMFIAMISAVVRELT